MSTPIKLRFDLARALLLAEHAVAAPGHSADYNQHFDNITPGPALHWVYDWGTYLMSNGTPSLPKADGGEGSEVVYADGWGPDSDRRALGSTAVGHDDGVDSIDLGDPADNGALINRMRRARTQGGNWLVLHVTNTELTVEMTK